MVVVGLLGSVVIAGVVVTARRRAAPTVAGLPDWAPLRLVEPAPTFPPDRSRSLRRDPVPADPPRTAAAPAATVPAATAPPTAEAKVAPWVQPGADGNCPDSHPVKGKRSSRIYHVPGGRYYETTQAERCFCDTDAAEADGYRASKR
jgi:hypothetical protein